VSPRVTVVRRECERRLVPIEKENRGRPRRKALKASSSTAQQEPGSGGQAGDDVVGR
jgi:hypothetical protein